MYRKLERRKKKAVDEAIDLFARHPFDPALNNHQLKGVLKGRRSISAGFDLRIVFREEGKYAFVSMIKVGSHEEVY